MANYVIGFSKPHKPGRLTGKVYVEDSYQGKKIIEEEIPADELMKTVEYYASKYKDSTICEFKY